MILRHALELGKKSLEVIGGSERKHRAKDQVAESYL